MLRRGYLQLPEGITAIAPYAVSGALLAIALTAADFDLHAQRAEIPLVVDFWAPWCGPCRMMAPAYEQAAQMLEPQVRLAKLNTEEEQSLAARCGISSIPTLVLLRGGRELARQPGALGLQDIVRWVRSKI